MLAELRMKLEADKPEFGFYQSSNLQGVLMERIDSGYAAGLHEQGLRPYSQHLFCTGKEREWVVCTTNREAYQQIILPLMDGGFTDFNLEKREMHITILNKKLNTTPMQELLQEFYSAGCDRYLNLEFVSPTAFKSDGRYLIFPETRHIFQSFMNKCSASSDDMEMYDEETLEQLTAGTEIIRYHLRSTAFPLEGVRIPSFTGEITIKVTGTETMARYVRFLARFGEYSGVGIKTAMGMGGLRIKERRRRNDGSSNLGNICPIGRETHFSFNALKGNGTETGSKFISQFLQSREKFFERLFIQHCLKYDNNSKKIVFTINGIVTVVYRDIEYSV